MKAVHVITWILLVIGGLNWLLVGFGFNLVDWALGMGTIASKIVYILVGISAIVSIFTHKKDCKACVASTPAAM